MSIYKVVVLDITGDIFHTYVFVGHVPKYVKDELEKLAKNTIQTSSTLYQYYGADYKIVLGLNTKTGGTEDLDEWIEFSKYSSYICADLPVNGGRAKPEDITSRLENDLLELETADTSFLEEPEVIADELIISADTSIEARDITEDTFHYKTSPNKITFIYDYIINSDDRLFELRNKIYTASDIPPYTQHIFWYEDITFRISHSYQLLSNIIYPINILAEIRPELKNQNDLFSQLNKDIFINKENITINSGEYFSTVAKASPADNMFFVVNINDYLININRSAIILDNYLAEVFYWCFIVKYFPQITSDMYSLYMLNPNEIRKKYPNAYPNKARLISQYIKEYEISRYPINSSLELTLGVSQTLTVVNTINTYINIRNLFEVLKVSSGMPFVYANIEVENKGYSLSKKYKMQSPLIPAGFKTRRLALSCVINIHKKFEKSSGDDSVVTENKYIYLCIESIGKYSIITNWHKEYMYDFDRNLNIIMSIVNPIIEKINNFGEYVFDIGTKLNLISKTTAVSAGANVSLFWKHKINETTFNDYKSIISKFSNAGIMSASGSQSSGEINTTFIKGMYEFDTNTINKSFVKSGAVLLFNQYYYYTNSGYRNKWNQLYMGRNLKISFTSSYVIFDLYNIKQNEFESFLSWITRFMSMTLKLNSAITINTTASHMGKLKTVDPALFNLKKYSNLRPYSIECQKPRQPQIYTESEFKKLSAKEKERAVKYHNFTYDEAAYYMCNKKYPHLMFITGVHPLGYCLPCCGKKDVADREINKTCLTKHVFDKDSSSLYKKHIMQYGKNIPKDRIAKITHPHIAKLLNADCHLYGTTISNNYFIDSILAALNINISTFVEDAKKFFSLNKNLFSGLAPGEFKNIDELMQEIKATSRLPGESNAYNSTIINIVQFVYNIGVITFNDVSNDVELIISNNNMEKYSLLVYVNSNYFPVFELDPKKYYEHGDVKKRVFLLDDIPMLKTILNKDTAKLNYSYIDSLSTKHKFTIAATYINLHNNCWGVDIKMDKDTIFIPLVESKINIINGVFSYPEKLPELSTLLKTLAKLGIVKTLNPEFAIIHAGKQVAFMHGIFNTKLLFLHEPTTALMNCPHKHISKDLSEINKIIKDTPRNSPLNAGKSFWNIHQYDLYITEFINYISNEKNTAERAWLYRKMKNTDFSKKLELIQRELLEKYSANDYFMIFNKLLELIKSYSSDKISSLIVEFIEDNLFEFDMITLKDLHDSPMDSRIEKLKEISGQFVTPGTPPDGNSEFVPNVIVSCSYYKKQKQTVPHCQGKKLIIDEAIYEKILGFVAKEIGNPFKYKYIFNKLFSTKYINYFNFPKSPDTTIEIKQLQNIL